jgi:hypothetical protein
MSVSSGIWIDVATTRRRWDNAKREIEEEAGVGDVGVKQRLIPDT